MVSFSTTQPRVKLHDLPVSIPSKDIFSHSETMLIVPQCNSCNVYHDFNRDTSVPLPIPHELLDS